MSLPLGPAPSPPIWQFYLHEWRIVDTRLFSPLTFLSAKRTNLHRELFRVLRKFGPNTLSTDAAVRVDAGARISGKA